MTSLTVPMLQWARAPALLKEALEPSSFTYDPGYKKLTVGFENGMIARLGEEGLVFVHGPSDHSSLPVDFLFEFRHEVESFDVDGSEDLNSILCVDRKGALMVLDSREGRCILYNDLCILSDVDVILACFLQANEHVLWVVRELGSILCVDIDKFDIVASQDLPNFHYVDSNLSGDGTLCLTHLQDDQCRVDRFKLENQRILIEHHGQSELTPPHGYFLNGRYLVKDKLLFRPSDLDKPICELPDRFLVNGDTVLLFNSSELVFKVLSPSENSQFTFDTMSDDAAISIVDPASRVLMDPGSLSFFKGTVDGKLVRCTKPLTSADQSDTVFVGGGESSSPVSCLFLSRKTARLWSGHADGSIGHWDVMTKRLIKFYPGGHEANLGHVTVFSENPHDPQYIVAVTSRPSLIYIDANIGVRRRLPLETGGITAMCWNGLSTIAIVEDNTSRAFDLESFEISHVKSGDAESLKAIRDGLVQTCDDSGFIGTVCYDWTLGLGQLYQIDFRRMLEHPCEEARELAKCFLESAPTTLGLGSYGSHSRICVCFRDDSITGLGTRQLLRQSLAACFEPSATKVQLQTPCSLSFLVKYWQDPNEHIRSSSRELFCQTLGLLSREQIVRVKDYWLSKLPVSKDGGPIRGSMSRAAIILAIMLLQGVLSGNDIPVERLYQSLLNVIYDRDQKGDTFRMPAVELVAKGLHIWHPHMQLVTFFKLIVTLGIALSPMKTASSSGMSLDVFSDFHYAVVCDAFSRLVIWSCVQNDHSVLVQWCKDVSNGHAVLADRIANLELMHRMLTRSASWEPPLPDLSVMKPLTGIIVEALVHLLDPNNGALREKLRPAMVPLLHALVTNYPNWCLFDQEHQLLTAVSPSLTQAIVYDLKTSTRVAVCAIRFDGAPDGSILTQIVMEDGKQLGALIKDPVGNFRLQSWTLHSGFSLFRSSKSAAERSSSAFTLLSEDEGRTTLSWTGGQLILCHIDTGVMLHKL